MKSYVKKALKELINSDKTKLELILKEKNDYKKNFLRLIYNKFILTIQTRIVPSHLKNFILRTTGMKVKHDVCFPHYIKIDPYFPELITLEKGVLVGGGSHFITHKIEGSKLILGKILIEERGMLGGGTTLYPGAILSKHAMIMFFSEFDNKIPEGELWGGKPAKLLKKLDDDEIHKYFQPSNGKYKEYYREFKQKVKGFLKDPNQNFFKINYNGKRLTAGDDWWRARNFFRIWYNGIIIEITRLMPHSWLKILLFRMAGMNIGKNVKIGKGTVFDHIFCDNITIEDNVIIENNCYLDGHEYTTSQTVFGKILVKKGVHIKHDSYVRVGTTIGENTIIEPNSMVQREIPPNVVYGGTPGKVIRELSSSKTQ
jgi:acetyltransferase-like isoleucine patch superfamily enzyme